MFIKICGITNTADAVFCVDAGASAIGINFVPSSPRCVSIEDGRSIASAVAGRTLIVGVVANLEPAAMLELKERVGLGCLQLHGNETPKTLLPLLPHAYKAIHIETSSDVLCAESYPGEYLLLDTKAPDALGGTGRTFDWQLVTSLAKTRRLVLAGGLHAENVALAIRTVRPFAVDVASGVEVAGEPREKAPDRVRAFIQAARAA